MILTFKRMEEPFNNMPRYMNFSPGEPFPIGNRFLVERANRPPEARNRIPIVLGPGRAFGSGQHETTIRCVEEMEKMDSLEGKRVLDVGTGTGILALAAALMDADRVVALDVQSDAASACSGNAWLNGVENRICTICGNLDSISLKREYDLILANIYSDIILTEAAGLAGRLRSGGRMILSGIDFTDSRSIRNRFAKEGLKEESTTFGVDYVTQVWVNPAPLRPGLPGEA